MGIPGLTTYISNESDRYLEYYALRDSYLVIDGNNICCQLYMWYARCNCAFGGDYDKYALCVTNFFDRLLKCNVTPLVLIDGGSEDKKLKTIISRTKQKTDIALNYTVSSQQRTKFIPLLLREIFKDVMNEKGIKYAQCLFEADNTIATLARILHCPVLSYDSDFYIYGSLYIPFNTLQNDIVSTPTGYMIRCKIYYVDKLFRLFYGLNQNLLFLAAILLGNDYVNQRVFKNFFRHVLQGRTKKFNNVSQRRINVIFHWLRRRSFDEAVVDVLSRLRKQERKHVLNTIETLINGYFNAPLNVLHILDVPLQVLSKANTHVFKTYKFQGDIYNLTYIDERTSKVQSSDDEIEDREITNIFQENELTVNESLIDDLPEWFIIEFKRGRFPSYFIDLIIRNLYICPVQIEDPLYVSSINASLKIINVIYGLLLSETKGKRINMKYINRDENKRLKRYRLEYNDNLLGCRLPSLSTLRELPVIVRRDILNTTLVISDTRYIDEIPSNWMLYIATMKYWIDQQQEPCRFTCHTYALLFALLFNIIDYNIGFYRVLKTFHQKYNRIIDNIRRERKAKYYRSYYSNDVTLVQAINEVDRDDCLLAATFFLSNFEIDHKLYTQPKKFNIAIVHGFAEFQMCLRHIMNFNALLGYPYEPTKIATLYNGTLLYNLCSNFKRRDNVQAYIALILQDSPTLLRLFNVLLSKVKPFIAATLDRKTGRRKKQKTNLFKKEDCVIHEDDYTEATETYESTSERTFFDGNNPFSILGIQH